MKIKLALVNLSFIIFLIGLFCTVGIGMKTGAAIVLVASALVLTIYIIQTIQSIRQNNLWSIDNLLYTVAILVSAVIFIHGFSVSIDMPLLGNIPGFGSIYLVSGILLITLFLVCSIRSASQLEAGKKMQALLTAILTIVSCTFLLGLFGMSGIIPVSGWLITYSLIFILLFYLIFFMILYFSTNKEQKPENWISAILSGTMILFLIVRFMFPQLMPQGLANSIVSFGFIPIIILPLSILTIKRFHFFTVFVFYFIFLDLYFIHTNRNLNYLITVGVGGCEGYEDANNYPINTDPGMPIEDLLKEPQESELNIILKEWQEKDFTPMQIQIEYEEVRPNGDSIKVVSHLVNGQKHYGLIRVPKGINIQDAPILLGLMGGGTGIDVLKVDDVYRLSSGKCRQLLTNFITIMPSFRGDIVRGNGFCYRSEGYAGNTWLGAAEDAIAFLEVVKAMYSKRNVKVLAKGVSRGATVALIIGGLTDKVDYIIANSTHTKFLDQRVISKERVGGSFSRAFYTPKASPEEIRKRLIASSPYYFANKLPAFEIHQSTEDQKTTVWHARILENRLKEIGGNSSAYNIYIYEGKGHGYDDDDIVCASLTNF